MQKRHFERYRAADYAADSTRYSEQYFEVFERHSDESVGYLADISSKGMMLLSRRAIDEGTILALRVELPEEIKGSNQLLVDARCIWCQSDVSPGLYRVGFAFETVFPHHVEILDALFKNRETPEEPGIPEEKTTTSN